jgi:hypothetical protein
MEILDDNIQNHQLTSRQWWASRRSKYNKGLVIAGITAFFTYAILGSILFADDMEFEITIFTTAFQGIGYLIMMGIANLLYNFGSPADSLFNKTNDEKFRQRLFNLGYWFSFGLPFLIPVLLIVMYFVKY